ncbi:MAG: magnesium transporter, partial [Miltoncostaeaceae bacterium]|nr:magnesium transporter [Miltoncostaeaceae bacterium]
LNDVIRLLTILSAVILPLTLVTGFYGMNVDALPLARNGGWSIVFTIAVMVVIGAGLLLYFRRKKWL